MESDINKKKHYVCDPPTIPPAQQHQTRQHYWLAFRTAAANPGGQGPRDWPLRSTRPAEQNALFNAVRIQKLDFSTDFDLQEVGFHLRIKKKNLRFWSFFDPQTVPRRP